MTENEGHASFSSITMQESYHLHAHAREYGRRLASGMCHWFEGGTRCRVIGVVSHSEGVRTARASGSRGFRPVGIVKHEHVRSA
jgi:hypothetical protein